MNSKSKNRDSQAQAYLDASRGSSGARKVKNAVYSAGKGCAAVGEVAEPGELASTSDASYPTVGTPDTPINNMGENSCGADGETVEAVDLVMTDSGKTKIQMVKRPGHDNVCVIDWINFTVLEDTFFKTSKQTLISNEEIVSEASRQLEKIFGFGITSKRDGGMNFYKESWVLGDEMGFVCFGGQRSTMLITLNGQGCVHAFDGWQNRLFNFLVNVAVRPSISRIDLAHDDLEGNYLSVDWAEQQWSRGGYNAKKGGRAPAIECVGNWHKPNGAGRTLYIGTRTSGKFCRFYEKGKKEGDASSLWCRVEVEFKSSDRIIPFEILKAPSGYFAGAYPCFVEFANYPTLQRLELKQKTAEIVVQSSIDITRHQFGKYLRVFRDLYGDKQALDLVCNGDKNAWPKRLKRITSNAYTGGEFLHNEFENLDSEMCVFNPAVSAVGLAGANCYQ